MHVLGEQVPTNSPDGCYVLYRHGFPIAWAWLDQQKQRWFGCFHAEDENNALLGPFDSQDMAFQVIEDVKYYRATQENHEDQGTEA